MIMQHGYVGTYHARAMTADPDKRLQHGECAAEALAHDIIMIIMIVTIVTMIMIMIMIIVNGGGGGRGGGGL